MAKTPRLLSKSKLLLMFRLWNPSRDFPPYMKQNLSDLSGLSGFLDNVAQNDASY